MKRFKITLEKRETEDVFIDGDKLDGAFSNLDRLLINSWPNKLPRSLSNLKSSNKPCFLKPTIVAVLDESGKTIAEDEVIGFDKNTGMPILWLDEYTSDEDGQMQLISRREIFR